MSVCLSVCLLGSRNSSHAVPTCVPTVIPKSTRKFLKCPVSASAAALAAGRVRPDILTSIFKVKDFRIFVG